MTLLIPLFNSKAQKDPYAFKIGFNSPLTVQDHLSLQLFVTIRKDSELTLNGDALVSQGREDQTNLKTELKEMLETMTYDKLMETAAARAESIQKQLKYVPLPNGLAIFMG